MEHWYTLHTKPNAEYRVMKSLEHEGFEVYLPQLEVYTANKQRKLRPFFPCYLFVQVDFETVSISQVQWTPGLRQIVSFAGRPARMPAQAISLIQQKLAELGTIQEFSHNFQPGDTVRITEGPFQDMLAIFKGPTTPRQRVEVLLKFLGQANRAIVDVTNLEKADSDETETPPAKKPRRTRGRGRRISLN